MVKDYKKSTKGENEASKILHIISGDIWAGAEVQVFQTISALSKKKEFKVICLLFNDGILRRNLEKKGIETILLDETKHNCFSLCLKLKKIIHKIQPCIIHVHKVKEHFLGRLSSLSIKRKIPVVRTVHGGRKTPGNLPFRQYLRSGLVVAMDNYLIKHSAEAVISVSKDIERELIKKKVKGALYQINNSIDLGHYSLPINKTEIRKQYGTEDLFWIGTAARLVEVKNLQMLIKAGKLLSERAIPFKISIFGEGPLRNDLFNQIKNNNLIGKVELHGFEPNILPLIKSFDAFVLCSFHEGLPMALLESMLLGTTVVCTAVGGIIDVIENDRNGILVPPNDAKALADSLVKLFKDPEKSAELKRNARQSIDERFSLQKTIEHLYNAYNQILSHG